MPLWQPDTGIITFSKRCDRCCAKKENASVDGATKLRGD